MSRRLIRPDSVALAGSVIGVCSLLFGWLSLRPNRLANGISLNVWDSFGAIGAAALALLWLLCLALSLAGRRRRGLGMGVAATAVLTLTAFFSGLGSRQLLAGEPEIARVSIGAGVWLTLLGAYMVVFASRQSLGPDQKVWRTVVSWGGLVTIAALITAGWLGRISILVEFSGYRERFWQEFWQHIRLFGTSVIAATVIGVLLGILAARSRLAERPVFFVANTVQAVPSLALFGLLIAPLSALSFAYPALRDAGIRGVGATPAVIALTIYSLLPVVQNTYTALRHVDRGVIESGFGMGMSKWQVFRKVEAPLAAPLVLEGVRTASVQAVGLTAVAALIGAGGLGWFVLRGIGQAAPDLIILGAIPIIVLALAVDGVMRVVVRLGTPKGTPVRESRTPGSGP